MTSTCTTAQACPQCGLRYQCICHQQPQLSSHIQIALLTHPNELKRATNTGKLLTQTLVHCQQHIWHRTEPPQTLLTQIAQQPCYLLFPSVDAQQMSQIVHTSTQQSPLFIILDGTWQEAKKILNKSPWLQALPKLTLSTDSQSNYSLRRNQASGNLCTCEVGINLLQHWQPEVDVQPLQDYFNYFLQVYQADRNHQIYRPN